jgi:hypothetical protein
MTTRIKIKKGAGTPSGLTFGELAYDLTNKKLFIGITGGNALLANTDGGVASFNGITGAVTGVTTGVANTFGPLQSFTSGISASNITTDYLVVAGGSTFGAAVDHVFGLSNRGLKINAGKGSSEILSYGNETLSVSGMGGNGSLELFGGNVTVGDDGSNNGTQIVLDDDIGQNISYAAANGHIFYGTGSFDGLLTASAGISASGGVTFAGTFSGSTGSFSRLLTASAGISASGGITLSGTLSLDTNALISSPSATAKAIKSTVPAGTGVTPTVQIICPSSAQSLLSQIATQPVFSTPQDTITLQASTTYMFEGVYLLSTGTVSHSTSMSFVLTTATMTNCTWITNVSAPAALNATAAGISTAIFNSVTGGTLNSANVQPYTIIRFQGVMRVNSTAGTLVPNIAFSAAPGGTNTTMIGSYLKFYPIGSNTIDFVGTAIG